MRIFLVASVLVLGACQSSLPKPTPPSPAVIKVPLATYVPIDAALTKRCSWVRDGNPSAVFDVSNGRKRCLDQYEAQLEAIVKIQGAPVP